MGDYARALTEGVVGNRQLVDDLAEAIAEKMVVKMTTTQPIPERLRTDSERGQANWAGSSAVECLPRTQEVRGSNPLQSTKSRQKSDGQRSLQISGICLLCSEA